MDWIIIILIIILMDVWTYIFYRYNICICTHVFITFILGAFLAGLCFLGSSHFLGNYCWKLNKYNQMDQHQFILNQSQQQIQQAQISNTFTNQSATQCMQKISFLHVQKLLKINRILF